MSSNVRLDAFKTSILQISRALIQKVFWQRRKDLFQCCGSGMFIPDPDFYPSRIPDPKTATKESGEKKLMSYLSM
jgi:hypothetical protein